MEDLKKNKLIVYIVVAALAFIFIAFCPAADIMGKAKVNGFNYVFQGEGLGFSRFLMFLVLIAPIVAAVFAAIAKPEKPTDKLVGICFAAGFVLAIITLIAMPTGVSFAFGAWLYVIFSLIGAAASFVIGGQKLPELPKK